MSTVTLERAERFSITARKTGRPYEISIAAPLPLQATGRPPEDCPILFVLDSSLTFGTAVERLSMYAAMGLLQPAVVVGIGYPGDIYASLSARTVDFTTATPAGTHAELAHIAGTASGGADEFLAFLLDELAPAVRARVPQASAGRVMLHGFSLGGLFAAYALLSRPEAFEAVSIISPSLFWNDFAVLKQLDHFKRRLSETGARPDVLIGVGALEQQEPQHAPPGMDLEGLRATVRKARMVDAARELAATVAALPVGRTQFLAFEAEDHAGALTAGTGRAIGFALAPRGA